ncbi:MAG TPA: hypothetical protein VMU88_02945, partial [bacterium]|nr:hypothetical protein [bacterium]
LLGGRVYFEGDLIAYVEPVFDFFGQSLARGHWPLWCPYLFGGQPFLADPNTMTLYPPAWLLLLPSKSLGMGLFYALHLFLAFFGLHRWLAKAGFSPAACRVGAVLYGLSGFFWWEIIHPQVEAGFAWLPWWGWALEGFALEGGRRWAFAAGLAFALLFLTGHFQIFLGAFYGGMIYFFYRASSQPLWRKPLAVKTAGGWLAAGIWGALPLLALAVPFLEFSIYSGRVREASDYLAFNAPLADDPRRLSQFLFPLRAWVPGQFSFSYQTVLENAGYLGIWWPWLFFLAFQESRRRGWFWFWSGAAVFSLLLCLGAATPLHRWVCDWVPGFSFLRAPYRFAYLYVLAGAFLGALGWMNWEERRPVKSAAFFQAWPAYALMAGLGLFYFSNRGPAFWGILLGAAGWAWGGRKKGKALAGWIFLAALALSMIWSGWRTCPSRLGPASNFEFLKNLPELAQIKQKAEGARLFLDKDLPYPVSVNDQTLLGPFPVDLAEAVGLRSLEGYNPLGLWKTSQLFSLPFQTASKLFALEGVVKAPNNPFAPPGFVDQKMGPLAFSQAAAPHPFVYAPGRLEVVEGEGERLALMARKDFDPYRLSYLSQAPPEGRPSEATVRSQALDYQWIQDDPDEEVFRVGRREGGWTVFSEVMYPGWKALVDGKPAPILTANHVFRAVEVPAGSHEVRFSYEPFWWTPVRAGLLLWLLSVAALLRRPFREWALGL